MKAEKNLRTPEEQPETISETVVADEKQKRLDELIEKFHRDNPAKNSPKTYRGVY